MAMATTSLQVCTPCVAIIREAAYVQKCNSSVTAAAISHRGFGFEKTFPRGGGRRKEPAAVLQSPSTSSCRGSDWAWGHSARMPQMQSLQTVRASEKVPVNVEMLEAYEIEEKVRDYELDHYGVVNNAIYAQFCQHARHELLEHVGFSPDAVTASGKSMAITDMTLKYFAPLRSGDRYIVSSRVSGTTAARIYFEDSVYKLPQRELVMQAKATVVILDENYRPTRIADEVKIKLLRYKTRTTNDLISSAPSTPQTNGSSTNGHVKGDSSGHISGSSRDGHINGDSESLTELVNANLQDEHDKDYSANGYINGKSSNGCVNRRFSNGSVATLVP